MNYSSIFIKLMKNVKQGPKTREKLTNVNRHKVMTIVQKTLGVR